MHTTHSEADLSLQHLQAELERLHHLIHRQVRLWRDSRQSGWRASLRRVRTGQTHHFARPEALWAFLQAEIDSRAAEPPAEAAARPEKR